MGHVKRVLGMSLDFNLLARTSDGSVGTGVPAGKASAAASPDAKSGAFAQLLKATSNSNRTGQAAPAANSSTGAGSIFDSAFSTIIENTTEQGGKSVSGKAVQESTSQGGQVAGEFSDFFQTGNLLDTITQLSANLAAPNPNAPVVIDPALTQIDPAAFSFGDLLDGVTQNTALSGTPGVISGPILGNLDTKAVVSPLPATAPGVQSGPVIGEINLKTTPQPQPATAPGTPSGPILAGVDPKTQLNPLTATAPGVQSGPIIAGADQKLVPLPQTVQTPGVITGPIGQEASTKFELPPGVTRLYQAALTQTKAGGAVANLRTASSPTTKKTGLKTGSPTNPSTVGPKPGVATPTAPTQQGNVNLLSGQAEPAPADVLADNAKQDIAKPVGQSIARADNSQSDFRLNTQSDGQNLFVKPEAVHTPNAGKGVQNLAHTPPRLDQANLAAFSASMAQRLQNGATKFEIRLDPAALGKVQVRLEVSADNRVEALVSTQRPEVLADLQRGADSLRRALQDAGFDLGSDGLNFSLDQGSGQPSADQEPRSGSLQAYRDQPDETLGQDSAMVLAQSERGYGLTRIFTDRLDVRI
jgi:flagellar hook-length control protein FliK